MNTHEPSHASPVQPPLASPRWRHTFAQKLPELAYAQQGATFPHPCLLLLNDALADDLGLDSAWLHSDAGVAFLTGQTPTTGNTTRHTPSDTSGAKTLPEPIAMAYAGHQFGQYSPLLGDGRALLLAEIEAPSNLTGSAYTHATQLYDIHAKGTGPTPFSRGGDGKCTLASALREYLMCEAMHSLDIPTTRALAVITTGEMIQRAPSPAFASEDQVLPPAQPGAIIVRVASSHLRVGTFELVRRSAPQLLPQLTTYAAERHGYSRHTPDAPGTTNATDAAGVAATTSATAATTAADIPHTNEETEAESLLRGVVKRQADLVAQWLTIGFVHGVMNTDNCTISGETIDYGPCAFLDAHDPRARFSSIDTQGRYAFGAQPTMAAWNVGRLAEALLPVFGSPDRPNESLALAQEIVDSFGDCFSTTLARHWLPKLGIPASSTAHGDGCDDIGASRKNAEEPQDEEAIALLRRWQGLLASTNPDHTNAHRALRDIVAAEAYAGWETKRDAHQEVTRVGLPAECASWVNDWQAFRRTRGISHEQSLALMDHANPIYVPRNHLVTEALVEADSIVRAALGSTRPESVGPASVEFPTLQKLLSAVTDPYVPNPALPERYAAPAPQHLGHFTSYCGT